MSPSILRPLLFVLLLALSGGPALAQGPRVVGASGAFGSCATANTLAKFTAATTLGCSLLTDDGTNVTLASGQLLLPNGTAAAPSLTWTESGFYRAGINDVRFAQGSVDYFRLNSTDMWFHRDVALGWGSSGVMSADLKLYRDASDTLAQRRGATAQILRVYNTTDGAGNSEFLAMDWVAQSNTLTLATAKTGTGTVRALDIGTRGAAPLLFRTGDSVRWAIDANGVFGPNSDGTLDLGATGAARPGSIFVAKPSITSGAGAGLAVVNTGEVRRVTHKVTVTYAALAAAALTADKTIAILPAKTRLCEIIADTTTSYTGGGVTAATLIVGKSVGGNEYIVSHDVLSAAIRRGEADVDLGTSINRANAIQGCDPASWTATTNISVRLTTVTQNTNQLTAGSTTYYITTESRP